jgi:hypothetical protein
MVNAEITSRSKRTAMSALDLPSQHQIEPGGAGGQASSPPPPFSLTYRLHLLRLHRPAGWAVFHVESRKVDFEVWRACQLRLVLLLTHIVVSVHQSSVSSSAKGAEGWCDVPPGIVEGAAGRAEDEWAGGGLGNRWQVEGEVREYSSAQLLQAVTRIAEELASMRAPSDLLWESYCEESYRAQLARLERFVECVRRRAPWVDSYGPLSVHMLEYLLATGCFDDGACPTANRDDVVTLLRAVREALDLPDGVGEAALAVTFKRMYLHSRDLDTLLRVQHHLACMQALPDRSFATAKGMPGSGAGRGVSPYGEEGVGWYSEEGMGWYKVAVLEEITASLRRLLSDAHAHFIDPIAEIPAAVAVFVQVHALLRASARGGAAGGGQTAAEEVMAQLKASVRARFTTIFDDQALEDGTVNVAGCIEAVSNLVEEVEVEALYFATGYASLVPHAVGIAVLEYVTCCQRSVEESVQSFRTLSGEAVRLWRALSALKQVIVRVVPAESKNELSSAVRTLAQLNSLFERCVQNWMDDEASRYAEVLANCIELEKTERWATLPNSAVSSSVVDLFHMFHETVPQLFGLGLPLSKDDVLRCIAQVDLFVMKYVVLAHLFVMKYVVLAHLFVMKYVSL